MASALEQTDHQRARYTHLRTPPPGSRERNRLGQYSGRAWLVEPHPDAPIRLACMASRSKTRNLPDRSHVAEPLDWCGALMKPWSFMISWINDLMAPSAYRPVRLSIVNPTTKSLLVAKLSGSHEPLGKARRGARSEMARGARLGHDALYPAPMIYYRAKP
jgi:hypothetical protein